MSLKDWQFCPGCGRTYAIGSVHVCHANHTFVQEPLQANKTALNTAPKLLNEAATTMEQRGKQYDKPDGERSMGRTVSAFNTILGREAITESEGWLLLQILKDVRDRQTKASHPDSLVDGIAYAALKAEARLGEG